MCAAPFDIDPGKGINTSIFHSFDGYSYHRNNQESSLDGQYRTVYLRCTKYSQADACSGRAYIRITPEDMEWIDSKEHVCTPDPFSSEARRFRHEVLEACRNEHYVSPTQLFNRIAERYSPNVVSRFCVAQLRTAMTSARMSQYPIAPQTLVELGRLLEQPQYQHLTETIGMGDSVFGGVIGFQGRECILFMSKRNGRYLSKVKEAFADATFVPAPLVPFTAQVYQIVCQYSNNIIPTAQILMPNKEYLTYLGMLRDLKHILPRFKPRKMHMDYERNPIAAWIEVFDVIVRGCFFHYVKADLKKVKELGLTNLLEESPEARQTIRCFLAIPLLPHDLMHMGFFILVKRSILRGHFDALLPFFEYFINTWMVGFRYETLSVFNQEHRTNNASEAAQRTLRRETGPHHPNIWHFINAIRRYEWTSYISTRRAKRALPLGRRQKIATLRNDRVIQRCSAELMAGRLSIKRFLILTSNRSMVEVEEILDVDGSEQCVLDPSRK